jgi:hypothetical protein
MIWANHDQIIVPFSYFRCIPVGYKKLNGRHDTQVEILLGHTISSEDQLYFWSILHFEICKIHCYMTWGYSNEWNYISRPLFCSFMVPLFVNPKKISSVSKALLVEY